MSSMWKMAHNGFFTNHDIGVFLSVNHCVHFSYACVSFANVHILFGSQNDKHVFDEIFFILIFNHIQIIINK